MLASPHAQTFPAVQAVILGVRAHMTQGAATAASSLVRTLVQAAQECLSCISNSVTGKRLADCTCLPSCTYHEIAAARYLTGLSVTRCRHQSRLQG